MQYIKRHSASVRYRTLISGVLDASYCGPIDAPMLIQLRDAVIAATPKAGAYIVRVSSALLLMGIDPFIPQDGDYGNLAGGVVICRQDQLEPMLAYSRHMANHGVVRGVFLESETDRAIAFAHRHAEMHAPHR